ncbi:MAG: outer membrane protein, partial [Paraglaciecola sp.]
ERVNFEQEILLNVQQFDLVRNQVALAKRAYDVSIKREDITRKRYYIGKIGITDLNIAISDMESARRNYIETLRVFWLAYYDIRRITLYDFEKGEALIKAKN